VPINLIHSFFENYILSYQFDERPFKPSFEKPTIRQSARSYDNKNEI